MLITLLVGLCTLTSIFVYSLCRIAAAADRDIERMHQQGRR